MSRMLVRNLAQPDEHVPFPKGKLEVATLDGVTVTRLTFEPGWSWHECVRPIVGGDSCDVRHFGYVITGRLCFRMDDGEERQFGPGDLYVVPPGHDTWVVGDEPCVSLNFTFAEYSRSRSFEEIRARMRAHAASG